MLKNNKIKIKNFCNILITISLFIIILFIIYNYSKPNYSKLQIIQNFQDAMPSNVNPKDLYGDKPQPVMENPKGCPAVSDVVEFCIDYDACCANNSGFNKCFCDHPSVKSCKNQYDACMQDPIAIKLYNTEQLKNKCKAQNTECCKAYNNITFSSSNFNEPIKNEQKDNLLCAIPPIKNITQKCLELCQTNPECAAYSTTSLSCNLYNQISPVIPKTDPFTGKPIVNTNIDFFSKKV